MHSSAAATFQDVPQDVADLPSTLWCKSAGVMWSITTSRTWSCCHHGASRAQTPGGVTTPPLEGLALSSQAPATPLLPPGSSHIEAALRQSLSPAWTCSPVACIMCRQAAAHILKLQAALSPVWADLQGVALLCPEPDPVEGSLPGLRALQPRSTLPKPLRAGAVLPAWQQAHAARVQVHLQVVSPVPDTAVSIQAPAARSGVLSWLISSLRAKPVRMLREQRRCSSGALWCTVHSKEAAGQCGSVPAVRSWQW